MANRIIKFQDYIEDVIKSLGCTEIELAKKLDKTQPFINRLRKGGAFPSYDTCWKLAHLTGDPIEKIVLIVEESKADPAMRSVWAHIIKTMTKAGVFTLSLLLLVTVLANRSSASTVTAPELSPLTTLTAQVTASGYYVKLAALLSYLKKKLKNALIPPFLTQLAGGLPA